MSIRGEIERAAKDLALASDSFHEIGKRSWEGVQEKLVETFLRIPHHHYRGDLHWPWERLKEPKHHLRFRESDAYPYLRDLIDDDVIWFAVEDDRDKYWFYEGNTDCIIRLIPEITGLSEYCLASKKYEWLLCKDHHDVLYGAGASVVDRMRRLQSSISTQQ